MYGLETGTGRSSERAMSRVRALELFASVFGLAGMYLGSTTLNGAMCYAVAIPCLIACVCARRLWGLLPLNLAQAVVIASFFLQRL
jgi:hypothetical protein